MWRLSVASDACHVLDIVCLAMFATRSALKARDILCWAVPRRWRWNVDRVDGEMPPSSKRATKHKEKMERSRISRKTQNETVRRELCPWALRPARHCLIFWNCSGWQYGGFHSMFSSMYRRCSILREAMAHAPKEVIGSRPSAVPMSRSE